MNIYIISLTVLQLVVLTLGRHHHHHRHHGSDSCSSSGSSESREITSRETTTPLIETTEETIVQTTEETIDEITNQVNETIQTFNDANEVNQTTQTVNDTADANINWYEINKERVEAHNRGNYTYKLKLNMFANYSLSSLKSKYLGLRMPKLSANASSVPKVAKSLTKKAVLPTTIDWRTHYKYPYDTEVKEQGSCGSCWAWSTTGTVEFALFKKNGVLKELSVQNLVDCSDNGGCDGGWLTTAYDYMIDNGVNLASDYPYKDDEGKCKFSSRKSVSTIKSYAQIDKDDYEVSNILAYTGPVAVAICATNNFLFYSEGVFNDEECNSECEVNHAVMLIGYGVDKKAGEYWLVRNSWGKSWGEDGYARVTKKSTRNCKITSWAYYPVA